MPNAQRETGPIRRLLLGLPNDGIMETRWSRVRLASVKFVSARPIRWLRGRLGMQEARRNHQGWTTLSGEMRQKDHSLDHVGAARTPSAGIPHLDVQSRAVDEIEVFQNSFMLEFTADADQFRPGPYPWQPRCRSRPTGVSQTHLNPTRQFILSRRGDKRIIAGHLQVTVSGDLRRLARASAHLLPPRDIGAPERVWIQPFEVAVFSGCRASLTPESHIGFPGFRFCWYTNASRSVASEAAFRRYCPTRSRWRLDP
jgi:hypothetical protein